VETQPRLLHRVLGLGAAAEHAVRHRGQVRALALELVGGGGRRGGRHEGILREMTVRQQSLVTQ
jgi:hypothetical protein